MRRALRSPVPDDGRRVAAREFAAIEHRFEDRAGFRRQLAEADLLLGPQQDARAQPVRLHQRLP